MNLEGFMKAIGSDKLDSGEIDDMKECFRILKEAGLTEGMRSEQARVIYGIYDMGGWKKYHECMDVLNEAE